MKWCGCAEERKAYFQKRRVRVKTIKHYRKDRKRKAAKGRMLKKTQILKREETKNGNRKTGSV